MRRSITGLVLLLLMSGAAGAWYFLGGGKPAKTEFRTEAVSRGDLTVSVAASGVLQPEESIDVGAQVGGMIRDLGKDTEGHQIDYNSPVVPGTVLAHIDDAIYRAKAEQSRAAVKSAEQMVIQAKAKVAQANANVDSAKANTAKAEADIISAQAKSNQATKDWTRAKNLKGGGSQAQAEFDAAQSAYETNLAGVTVAEAALKQAKAGEANAQANIPDAEAMVGVAEANLASAKALSALDEANLRYCTITSEVQGTIIDKRVTIGQTVQSSFNTPSLFLIAKDLKQMLVWASVNEADVGQVQVGQQVRFTVDKVPNRHFKGTVSRIRLNATNTQNVVVYTVEVKTDNPDLALYPYLTANLQFVIDRRKDIVLIPNSALRYKPLPALIASEAPTLPKEKGERATTGVVWVREGDDKVRGIAIKLGRTDGTNTEMISGDLEPATELVIGEVRAVSSGGANPFASKFGGGKK